MVSRIICIIFVKSKTNKMIKVLCVIDVQNDFIDGSLGTKEAQAVLPSIVDKIENWKGFTIATMDTHRQDYLSTREGKKLPVPHCEYNEKGWAMPDSVKKALDDSAYLGRCCKSTFGSLNKHDSPPFYAKDLVGKIESVAGNDDLDITLIGFCTDICIVSNALILRTYFPDASIKVDSLCCAGTSSQMHAKALDVMNSCQIEII